MRCPEVRDLLHCFLDGELEVDRNVCILKHLELCPPCRGRADDERRLRAIVASAAATPLPVDDRRRLLDAAYARVDIERARPVRWGRRLLLLAAGLLVAAGLSLYALDPLCWRSCTTLEVVRDAYLASLTHDPVPVSDLASLPPECSGLRCEGSLSGGSVPERCKKLLRYRCKRSGRDLVYLRLQQTHVHPDALRPLEDGRAYFELAARGVRVIGWREGADLACCVTAESVPRDALYAMARQVRDHGGGG